ncbi:dephospho-CoA kinase [Mycoplasmopsis felis]|uniref:Dephospho-CoA kinase n=1 Tax=Mycoplasmopsis felis TaxID=33923 RepID=A0A809RUQ2_9BACT|nr:dephospho-CoA kinase [Mycoplasmopsis felis]WQQ09774.1 dephospho-CoA kinase [Mycoplasmopsis felis]BBU47741.1 hypothetical protein JPM2_4340 [Mycoplasmopsis felis]
MKRIAIVGKIGVGKTWLLNKLKELNYLTINLDEYINNLYSNDSVLINLFKNKLDNFLIVENKINKNKIKEWILLDNRNFNKIENILYPYLLEKLKKEKYHFVEIPILNTEVVDFSILFDEIWNLTICPNFRKEYIKTLSLNNPIITILDKKNSYNWKKDVNFKNLPIVNISRRNRDNIKKINKILEKYNK